MKKHRLVSNGRRLEVYYKVCYKEKKIMDL
jgi:hypothetical protein